MLTMELAWSLLLLLGRKWRKIIHQHSSIVAAQSGCRAGPLPETKILFISLNVVEHWRIHVLRKRGKAQKVMRSGFWQWQPPLDRHVTKSGLMLLPWALLTSARSRQAHTHTHTLLSLMFACRQFAEQLSICGWRNLTGFSWKLLIFASKNCTLFNKRNVCFNLRKKLGACTYVRI